MIDKKFFVALLVVVTLILTFAAQAKVKTYTGVGEDFPNQFETPEDAKARALRSAIEDAKKQAGVGLKNYSRSINNELVDDEISTITSNRYKIVGAVKYESSPKQLSEKSFTVLWRATVDVEVDDAEVTDWIKRDAEEKKLLIKRNRAAEESFKADIQRADELSRRAAGNLTEAEEFDLRHEVEASNNDFQVNQKIEEGNRLNYENKPDEALEQYGEALKIKFVDGVGENIASIYEDLEIAKQGARERAALNTRKKVAVFLSANEISIIPIGDVTEDSYQILPQEIDGRIYIIVRANVRLRFNSDDVDKWIAEQKNKIQKR